MAIYVISMNEVFQLIWQQKILGWYLLSDEGSEFSKQFEDLRAHGITGVQVLVLDLELVRDLELVLDLELLIIRSSSRRGEKLFLEERGSVCFGVCLEWSLLFLLLPVLFGANTLLPLLQFVSWWSSHVLLLLVLLLLLIDIETIDTDISIHMRPMGFGDQGVGEGTPGEHVG